MTRTDRIYWYIGVSLILILLDYFSLLRPIKFPLENAITPVRVFIFKTRSDVVDLYQYISHFRSLSRVLTENAKLNQDNEEYHFQAQFLKSENEQLRRQLGAPLPASYQFIPGRVIAVYDRMEINIGQKDGVKEGMTVVLETTFVGKIKTVSQNRSTVILPTDPDLFVSAKTEKGARGVVTGQKGSGIILDKVLQKDPIFLNDLVLTSGEDGVPPNLLVGKIISITNNDTNAYKQAKLLPSLDFGKEPMVFVISAQ